jgi:Ca2+-binding EF-hand superfamily protein
MFAFDLYDRDGSGELNPPEVTRMVQDIYGKAEAKSNFHAKGYE